MLNSNRWMGLLLTVPLSLLLGCGSGGGGGSLGSGTNAAEGLWRGVTSDGHSLTAVVLENGELWAVSSSDAGVRGFLQGSVISNGGSISGSSVSYNLLSHTSTQGSFSGNVISKSSLSITSEGAFSAQYLNSYDQNAIAIPKIAGIYSGSIAGVSGTSSYSSTLSISSSGKLRGQDGSCILSGTIAPRASAKNIYNVNFAYSDCARSGDSMSGVAYYEESNTALVVLALNTAKTDGMIYVATRQVVGDSNSTDFVDPQGFYEAKLHGVEATREDLKLLVLENKEFWAIYGQDSASGFTSWGLLQGNGDLSDGVLSSTSAIELENLGSGGSSFGTRLQGFWMNSYSRNQFGFLNGYWSPSNGIHELIQASFVAAPPIAQSYSYSNNAMISDIVGSWTVKSVKAYDLDTQMDLNVAANGQMTISRGGCSLSGAITPRPSTKNVFTVSTNTIFSYQCSHVMSQGVAISYLIPGTSLRQILIAIKSASGMDLFTGVR